MRQIPLAAVRDAASAIYNVVRRTPLVRLGALPGDTRDIYLKLELLQPIGSFKIRGAWNVVRQLPPETIRDGVWTVSAGNAAQGVALAAKAAGVPCSVLVMDTAPKTKVEAIERLGASITRVTYDEAWRTVETGRSDRMRGHFIHPFDDDRFIAGNATVALEILEDLPDVDVVTAPIGGGGLVAGIGAVMRELRPDVHVVGAEPETAAPYAASLKAGAPSAFPGWQASFVDGAGGRTVLPGMWPLLSGVVGSMVVSLDETAAAMKTAAERCHVIAEGAAGCAIAAALSDKIDGRPGGTSRGKIVAVVSGGNIDLPKFASLVGACR